MCTCIRFAAGLLAFTYALTFCQPQVVEHLPDDAWVANWQPVFFKRIISDVQLPDDSAEYKKTKIYVIYRAMEKIDKSEELLKQGDLSRRRYLGAFLSRTGRIFSTLLDYSVLGREDINLTTNDQLTNNEMMSAGKEFGFY
ncbi:hypothetical protein [Dyadobacter sp. CY312]|uniref:hypothetical protein n=1 Tax=Dyadobacter sp. CY312 TaxID=2907303 RepID=UPI001F282982|nr:hypothetical protein [Dyadobacter sp. CY312]MCE7042871.1 hypothetical protein [Dyadobacter sp. CY312]